MACNLTKTTQDFIFSAALGEGSIFAICMYIVRRQSNLRFSVPSCSESGFWANMNAQFTQADAILTQCHMNSLWQRSSLPMPSRRSHSSFCFRGSSDIYRFYHLSYSQASCFSSATRPEHLSSGDPDLTLLKFDLF